MPQKRITIIILVICIIFAVLGLKLFSLQILNGSYYRIEAQKRATAIELIHTLRGKILDRNGTVLVQDSPAFDVYVIPQQIDESTDTITALARVLKIPLEDLNSRIDSIHRRIDGMTKGKTPRRVRIIRRQQIHTPHKLSSNISLQQAIEIEPNPEEFRGVVIKEKLRRDYIYGDLAVHIIGYLGYISREEYETFKRNDYFRQTLNERIDEDTYTALEYRGEFLDDQIGRAGVEKEYEKSLRGINGVRLIERDFVNQEEKELSRIPSFKGADLTLTIDLGLQQKIQTLLKGKVGSIIIMDVTNGEILALASSPTFNPNSLQSPVSEVTVQYIFHSFQKPLLNRAISGEYAAGSIFKIVTATAALQTNKIKASTTFNCDGYYSRKYRHFKCWIAQHNLGHGLMNVVDGLKHSCNVFFFNTGRLTGIDALADWARKFGFGKRTGIDLPGESKKCGLIPDPTWKKKRYQAKWYLADTLNLSIGQGDLMVTPLQIVRMMAVIANGGNLVIPHLKRDDDKSYIKTNLGIASENIALIRDGLYDVVNSPGGTAHNTGMNHLPVAGKTSTAEVGTETIVRQSHAWFIGYAPVERPRIAFVIMIEHGGKGSKVAAPLAAQFLPEALELAHKLNKK